jgi:hypothetical protein
MSRSLTDQEKGFARQWFPRMSVDGVVVSDEATSRYNCLAWTLGITTSWVWPWGSRNATKAEFDAFYRGYGFTPTSGSGTVAAFGPSLSEMNHGSITGPGHGPRWESKCGAWLRLQHGLGEMEGGTVYGDVRGFYSRTSFAATDLPQAGFRLPAVLKVQNMGTPMTLSEEEVKLVHSQAERVGKDLRDRFEKAYGAWRKTWDHPLIAVSSVPATRANSIEFLELVALGPGIVPLLMAKLTSPDDFFALVAVDRLLRPELQIVKELDDESALLGEQGRAVETVQRWLQSVA